MPKWLRELVRLGCTCGAVKLGPERVVHVRNMDWPVKDMGKATRVFRFVDGEREFVTVGVPAMVGALSGMVPGAYSASIDYAPPTFNPGFDFGPLFLLRRVFETCDTFEKACYALSHTKVSANVLRGALLLRKTNAPCVILENFFGDNPNDLKIARENLQTLAANLAQAVKSYFSN